MKIVIAPDSFKESLTAMQVAEAIKLGFQKVMPNETYITIPMADGGEGTVQSLVDATKGKLINVEVMAPLGNKINSFYGISGDGKIAIIEMAAASGLHLVPISARDPKITTSFGTGELILDALDKGVKRIILGIGGSATNDAGVGMMMALGAKFYNKERLAIPLGGAALIELAYIDLSALDARLQDVEIEVACDVNNTLCGEDGASFIFGPQKGADKESVQLLDKSLQHFADIVKKQFDIDLLTIPGGGAAGGMGCGLYGLLNANLKPGVDIVLNAVDFRSACKNADLVITGEGRMDAQSIRGKTPIGVAKLAKQNGCPVIAIVGCLREDYETVYEHGIDAVFPIIRQIAPLEIILEQGYHNLVSTAQNIAKLYSLKHTK